jgi:hypothetical protein
MVLQTGYYRLLRVIQAQLKGFRFQAVVNGIKIDGGPVRARGRLQSLEYSKINLQHTPDYFSRRINYVD